MEHLARLHATLIFTILLACAALALWALIGFARGGGPGERLRAGLAIAELLILAECALGVALLLQGARPARAEAHVMYGLVAAAALPIAAALQRGRDDRSATLSYGLVCLFLCAIALRALLTARG